MHRSTFLIALTSFRHLLNARQKKQGWATMVLIGLVSLADVIGLAAVVPILMLAIDGDFLAKSRKLRYIYKLSGMPTEGLFLIFLIIIVVIFFIMKNLLALLLQNRIKVITAQLVKDITNRKFNQIISKDYAEITSKGTPDLLNQMHFMPFHYATGIVLPFLNIISETIVVIFILLVFTIYNPAVFILIASIIGPAFYIINKGVKNKIYKIGQETKDLRNEAFEVLNLGINGLIDIKINNTHQYFLRKFIEKQSRIVIKDFKAISYQNIPARANELVVLLGVVILVIYGYFYSRNPGEMRILGAMFVLAVFRLMPAINRLLIAAMKMKLNQYTIDELKVNPITEDIDQEVNFSESIELMNVSFAFDTNKPKLYNSLSLTIKKGETVGIIGESGSGKSTLIRIISGLIENYTGSILIDGIKLNRERINVWQSHLGFVSQSPFVFNASIIENIIFGDINPDTNRVMEVLKMAGLEEFVLVNGLEYIIGESGCGISEGQKQRLAIARALYKKASVLILDEATSALDEETEKQILETIKNLANLNITIIIIAHKLPILEACDKVYELKNGILNIKNV